MGHPLWENFFRHQHDWVYRCCRLCESSPLFRGIPKRAIRWLVSRMHVRHFDAGETVFRMGDPGAGALLLLSGSVNIMINGVCVATLHEGDLFGEVALANDLPRTADAVTASPCEMVFFLRSDLQEWIDTSPRQASTLLVNLSDILARRLMQANVRYEQEVIPQENSN